MNLVTWELNSERGLKETYKFKFFLRTSSSFWSIYLWFSLVLLCVKMHFSGNIACLTLWNVITQNPDFDKYQGQNEPVLIHKCVEFIYDMIKCISPKWWETFIWKKGSRWEWILLLFVSWKLLYPHGYGDMDAKTTTEWLCPVLTHPVQQDPAITTSVKIFACLAVIKDTEAPRRSAINIDTASVKK